MKNTREEYRVFLDTSVLLSGLNSPNGASGLIISLFKVRKIDIVISPEVIEEAERVIQHKLQSLKTAFLDFLSDKPEITKRLTNVELKKTSFILFSEDTPIFAGAIKSRADFLLTLDKDFQKLTKGKTKCEVLTPGEFLVKYRAK
ncbi:putative toxin-antitoxin system toxin component, PIN family [Candidatus Giovannonibacteria bacterium RIFCSPLOWO2_02_FULL_45_14]|uniref:Putative toxin-antitoxin system toxin component, PIN family n=1 Tax=Candidatus Giovannonibacteria bacterium RIFCSPLOWO2_12_FULL_44_15 TaxID=1798364 RepID=A0A1F5Y0V8_9BACT|nr:MAG: putative toxin-antitoxin system toxin component, PIN family [Candidatus Giovannonibacteria bacterium RIFCSPHIGHO2_02_FULL_44_31]OGF76418.1 MAG: putative toxin-antitoxin system toxin component, PIN family [Candidatus Giovannonibacteria bacterium RIFCSPHIGHO2_12_FULL_44_29]OGF91090.1 MAG: putative toxin-antitoxin system toxin component, PIN family [Candidatus Giovannonibacteria bacterium RIFCSPLOWO2_02_FULL_45_14]OGF93787.1 MAG: putative toxin-antitoxin system toxin component, PIN family [